MQITHALLRVLKHNWPWKLFSLAAAIATAVLVYREQDVIRTASVFLPVNINAPGHRVAEPGSDFRVRVDLEGPGELLREITENEEIALQFDASRVKPGERAQVPVSVTLPERYGDRVLVRWRPRHIPVKLVADARRTLSVVVEARNHPPEWEFREPLRAQPGRVSVSGPDTALQSVARVTAPLDLEPTESINAMVRLNALDQQGRVVEQVQIEPAQALVTGMQERVALRKHVPVQPVFTPPPGVRVTRVQVTPPQATVVGPKGATGSVYVVETEPFRVPVGQTQVVRDVGLAAPAGGLEVTPNRVRVTLSLSPAGAARPPR